MQVTIYVVRYFRDLFLKGYGEEVVFLDETLSFNDGDLFSFSISIGQVIVNFRNEFPQAGKFIFEIKYPIEQISKVEELKTFINKELNCFFKNTTRKNNYLMMNIDKKRSKKGKEVVYWSRK